MSRYHSRRLGHGYVYLVLDGITLKVKGATGVRKRLVLSAYAITPDGHRELVGFRQASSESETQWLAFLDDLYNRGLEGKRLRLVATDGCPGLHNALEVVHPYVPRQSFPGRTGLTNSRTWPPGCGGKTSSHASMRPSASTGPRPEERRLLATGNGRAAGKR